MEALSVVNIMCGWEAAGTVGDSGIQLLGDDAMGYPVDGQLIRLKRHRRLLKYHDQVARLNAVEKPLPIPVLDATERTRKSASNKLSGAFVFQLQTKNQRE